MCITVEWQKAKGILLKIFPIDTPHLLSWKNPEEVITTWPSPPLKGHKFVVGGPICWIPCAPKIAESAYNLTSRFGADFVFTTLAYDMGLCSTTAEDLEISASALLSPQLIMHTPQSSSLLWEFLAA